MIISSQDLGFSLLEAQSSVPCGSDGKESASDVGDLASIPGSGRSPREGNGSPGEFYEQRSLVGYSSWDPKELLND